jgi:hypothetical protein
VELTLPDTMPPSYRLHQMAVSAAAAEKATKTAEKLSQKASAKKQLAVKTEGLDQTSGAIAPTLSPPEETIPRKLCLCSQRIDFFSRGLGCDQSTHCIVTLFSASSPWCANRGMEVR